jgi:hypothetical protein
MSADWKLIQIYLQWAPAFLASLDCNKKAESHLASSEQQTLMSQKTVDQVLGLFIHSPALATRIISQMSRNYYRAYRSIHFNSFGGSTQKHKQKKKPN